MVFVTLNANVAGARCGETGSSHRAIKSAI
jgi:hypothetical protein